MSINPKYAQECLRLEEMLQKEGIPFEASPLFDGRQIHYPAVRESKSDVVCHSYSYGHEEGLLEQMGLLPDTDSDAVLGSLTAEQVFDCWKKDWDNRVNRWKPIR